jgi:hypothetical protein
MPEKGRTVAIIVFIESDTGRRSVQQLCQCSLALLDRHLAQILAVKLEQIEGAKDNVLVVAAPTDHLEDREAILVAGDRFTVNKARARRQGRYRRSG